jgi:outer membrane biosynthesis protein TonB
MNRLKLWIYALLVVAVGAFTLREHSRALRDRAVADVDARLAAAAAQVAASNQALAREVSAAAALTVADANLVRALNAKELQAAPLARGRKSPKPAAPPVDEAAEEAALADAARTALSGAEKTFGFSLPDKTVVTAGNREWLARKGAPSAAEAEPMTYLRAAIAGESRRGYVRLDSKLWYAAAAPAGDGAGLVVLVPLDDAWAKAIATGAGVDVTLSVPDVKPITTARPADAKPLAGWSRAGEAAVDIGRAGNLDARLANVSLPKLPLLFASAPAQRARGLAIDGVRGGFTVVSAPLAPALAQAGAFQWLMLLGLGILLVIGVVVGFFVGSEPPAPLPDELVQAAVRIEAGDFSARAPPLAGKLGTIGAAMNKAAEIAGPAAAMATASPSVSAEFFARASRLSEPEADAGVSMPVAPAQPVVAPEPTPEPQSEPAPEPEPAPAREAAPDPFPPPPPDPFPPPPPARGETATAFPAASVPDLLAGAAQTAAPAAPEVDEEGHWQQVFQDFLHTRSQCGETTDGLTFDKFRVKLEGNRSALVAKYGCKTVRFQVYVKEGKAALKATPVK